jgi:predicted DNA-binding transcriptional regulator AlpA
MAKAIPVDMPARGVTRDEAALLLGFSTAEFDAMVAAGHAPAPRRIDDDVVIWDWLDLQALGGVYFVGFAGYIKIGWSKEPSRRIIEVQDGSPEPITIHAIFTGSKHQERAHHDRFAADRRRGEWFRHSPALAAFLKQADGGIYAAGGQHG